jgi:hypothetical protein
MAKEEPGGSGTQCGCPRPRALLGPGESYSDVILRLAKANSCTPLPAERTSRPLTPSSFDPAWRNHGQRVSVHGLKRSPHGKNFRLDTVRTVDASVSRFTSSYRSLSATGPAGLHLAGAHGRDLRAARAFFRRPARQTVPQGLCHKSKLVFSSTASCRSSFCAPDSPRSRGPRSRGISSPRSRVPGRRRRLGS